MSCSKKSLYYEKIGFIYLIQSLTSQTQIKKIGFLAEGNKNGATFHIFQPTSFDFELSICFS